MVAVLQDTEECVPRNLVKCLLYVNGHNSDFGNSGTRIEPSRHAKLKESQSILNRATLEIGKLICIWRIEQEIS